MPINPKFQSLYDLQPSAPSGTLRGFLGRSVPFDPGEREHQPQLKAIEDGIMQGIYSDEDISAFAQKNPQTTPFLQQAIQKRNIYRQNFQPAVAPDPLTAGELQGSQLGAQIVDPNAQASSRDQERLSLAEQGRESVNNLQGAILELNRAGQFGEANKLLQQAKTSSEGSVFAKISPKDYTRTSVEKFERSRRFSDLEPSEKLRGDRDKAIAHATKLRDEFSSLSKPFREVRDSYARIQASAKDPSAAGDLALIFNYMKMLDPGSVVRETEFATAQNSAGVPERIRAMYNKTLQGERLSPNTRTDFVKRSDALFSRQKLTHKKLEDQYSALARRTGVSDKDVIVDFNLAEPEKKPLGTSPSLSPEELRELENLRRKQR